MDQQIKNIAARIRELRLITGKTPEEVKARLAAAERECAFRDRFDYVVVNDVTDMQGNVMASPVVLDLYVYRNPLRWTDKRIRLEAAYGEGLSFEATVKNLSGVKQNFKVEDLPLWINASQTEGVPTCF